MSARKTILNAISTKIQKTGTRGSLEQAQQAVDQRLSSASPNLIPTRAQKPHPDLVAQFVDKLEKVQATCTQVDSEADIPAAVAAFLRKHNLPSAIKLAPDPRLVALDWTTAPLIETSQGPADGSESSSLTTAVKGISETGTLILHSEAKRPTSLNFLPEHHLVVLNEDDIVGAYEHSFADLKQANPRTINMITGPSRTGDIEQTLYLGAHGPRKLHVILIASKET